MLKNHRLKMIFMQDSAFCHTAANSIVCLNDIVEVLVGWPLESPDLNRKTACGNSQMPSGRVLAAHEGRMDWFGDRDVECDIYLYRLVKERGHKWKKMSGTLIVFQNLE
jgi:hypothetical protein